MDPNQWRQILQGLTMQGPPAPQGSFMPPPVPTYQMPQLGMEVTPGKNMFSGQMDLPGGFSVSGSASQNQDEKAVLEFMLRKRMQLP